MVTIILLYLFLLYLFIFFILFNFHSFLPVRPKKPVFTFVHVAEITACRCNACGAFQSPSVLWLKSSNDLLELRYCISLRGHFPNSMGFPLEHPNGAAQTSGWKQLNLTMVRVDYRGNKDFSSADGYRHMIRAISSLDLIRSGSLRDTAGISEPDNWSPLNQNSLG